MLQYKTKANVTINIHAYIKVFPPPKTLVTASYQKYKKIKKKREKVTTSTIS